MPGGILARFIYPVYCDHVKYRFDKFVLDTGARELSSGESMIPLEPRTYELLVYLLEHRNDAVSKDELQDEVWKTIVSESAVTRSIMKLRKALGDSDESIIKTVPRFGYKFHAIVIREDQDTADETVIGPGGGFSRAAALAAAAIAVVSVTAYLLLNRGPDTTAVSSDLKSVAVLPFDDMSEAQDQAWFASGLAEELLNALARTPDLLVASRTSSFAYRDSNSDIREIADNLGVAHIVEGSVRRDSRRIRVTAQLIRAKDGFHVWSETYDEELDNLIETQERIALAIANALETTMDPEALQRMLSSGTRSVEAFEAYLEGLAGYDGMVRSGNVDEYTESIDSYVRAVSIDPEFALAYSEIADYWSSQLAMVGIATRQVSLPRDEIRKRYDEAKQLAIHLSEDPARKLYLQADDAYFNLELRSALDLTLRYLELRPNDWRAQARHLNILSALNRYDELIVAATKYMALDTNNPVVNSRAMHTVLYSMDEHAIRQLLSRFQSRSNDSVVAKYQEHRALLWLGELDQARETLRIIEASDMQGRNKYLARLRQACAEGNVGRAAQLRADGDARYADDASISWLGHKIMGHDELAIAALAPLDDMEVAAFSGFLDYGAFDPSAHPALMEHLRVHGEEDGSAPIPIPYRCSVEVVDE